MLEAGGQRVAVEGRRAGVGGEEMERQMGVQGQVGKGTHMASAVLTGIFPLVVHLLASGRREGLVASGGGTEGLVLEAGCRGGHLGRA